MAAPGRVIYLDVDDEITSAAARIRGVEGTRVALVIPPGSRVATSRINFRLLAREAQAHGRRLAIVAPDAASRALAAAAGLEVYGSAAEYETAMAAPPRPTAEARPAAGAPSPDAPSGGAPAGPAADAATMTGISTRAVQGPDRPQPGTPAGPSPAPGPPIGEPPPPPEDLRPRSGVVGLRAVGGGTRRVIHARGLLVVGAIVLAAALVVGGVAAYVLLPAATILVTPRLETLGPVSVTVTADPAATSVDTTAGVVPARTISLQVQASSTYKATGLRVDEAKATGTVTFTSRNTGSDVSIPAGTQVSTASGVVFVTTKDVVVPKATFLPPTPGTADVAVAAVSAGPDWNVPSGSITRAPTTVQALLVNPDDPVNNAQPTSGGKRDTFPQVSQADVVAAQADLQKQLEARFAAQLADPASVPAGLTLFPETAQLGGATPTTDPASLVGKGVAQFTLGLSATGNATAVDEKPLAAIAETRLRSSVQPGYALVAGSVKTTVGKPTVAGATVTFPTSATARQVRQLDASALEAQVRGLSVDQAEQLLSQYGTVSISTWPDWVSTIPSYDFRIDLTVRSSAPVESPGAGSSSAPSASPGAATPSPSP